MRLSRSEIRRLQYRPNQLVIESQHLVQKFTVFDVVASLVTVKLDSVGHQLFVSDVLENQEIRLVLIVVVTGLGATSLTVEKALGTSMSTAHRRVYSPIRDCG